MRKASSVVELFTARNTEILTELIKAIDSYLNDDVWLLSSGSYRLDEEEGLIRYDFDLLSMGYAIWRDYERYAYTQGMIEQLTTYYTQLGYKVGVNGGNRFSLSVELIHDYWTRPEEKN